MKGKNGHRLHRLASVRRRTGVTRATIARKLDIPLAQVRSEEAETSDIRLSDLLRWRKALGVPLAELLCDAHVTQAGPPLDRTALRSVEATAEELERVVKKEGEQHLIRRFLQEVRELLADGKSA